MTNTKKRTIIVNKRRFFSFVLLATLLVNLLFVSVCLPRSTQADAVEKTQEIIVCAGDTMWSIAEEYGSENEDVRNTVYKIKKLNDLNTTSLTIGQVLLVPIV